MDGDGWPTPETAALAGWSWPRTVAGATISPRGDEAFVLLAGDPGGWGVPMHDVTCRLTADGWVELGGGGGFCGDDGYPFAYPMAYGVAAGLAVRAPGRRSAEIAFVDGPASVPVRPDGWAFAARWYAGAESAPPPRLVAVR